MISFRDWWPCTNLVKLLWPGDKKNSLQIRHSGSPRLKYSECTNRQEKFMNQFLEPRRHPPLWLSPEGPKYQHGVLLIPAGVNEGHLKEKLSGKFTKMSCSCTATHDHQALATQKKQSHLGFQCLYHQFHSNDVARKTTTIKLDLQNLGQQAKKCIEDHGVMLNKSRNWYLQFDSFLVSTPI